MAEFEIRHAHLFCGLGGGAAGFNQARPDIGTAQATFRCIGGIEVDAAAIRDFDRITQQLLGTSTRPAPMPMDAWREGDHFIIEFDLPGVAPETIDLDVERNVLTVRAERLAGNGEWQMLANERARGAFSRQLVLGDNLDLERIEASLDGGVLRLSVPVAERAKPRKIELNNRRPAALDA